MMITLDQLERWEHPVDELRLIHSDFSLYQLQVVINGNVLRVTNDSGVSLNFYNPRAVKQLSTLLGVARIVLIRSASMQDEHLESAAVPETMPDAFVAVHEQIPKAEPGIVELSTRH